MPRTIRSTLIAGRLVALLLTATGLTACLPSMLAGRGPATASPPSAMPSGSPGPAITPSPGSTPAASVPTSPAPSASPAPVDKPSPTPAPTRGPVDVNLVSRPAAQFISEIRKTWCAAAGTQMVLALDGNVPLTSAAQAAIVRKSAAYWSWADSHNRGWGPLMIARVLAAYGVPGYEVRTYSTRGAALLDAAAAIETTRRPVLLLAWWGAHTWVMTGFRASADPLAFPDAVVTGAYVLDPWYPRISSIWGPSDPPGTFQDAKEMVRNYVRWTRPEGRYPGRDGRFVAVVPTLPAP